MEVMMKKTNKVSNIIEYYYDKACLLFKWSLIFWVIETVFFLIVDGWHTSSKASRPEQICDFIVNFGLALSIYLFVKCLSNVVELNIFIYKQIEKEEGEEFFEDKE